MSSRCVHGYNFDHFCPTCNWLVKSIADNPDTRFAKTVAQALGARLYVFRSGPTCRDIAGADSVVGAVDVVADVFKRATRPDFDKSERLCKIHLDALLEWIDDQDKSWVLAQSCHIVAHVERGLLDFAQSEKSAPWGEYLIKLSSPFGWVSSVLCESVGGECYVLGAWSVVGEWFNQADCDDEDLRVAYLAAERSNWLIATSKSNFSTGSSIVYLSGAGADKSGSTRISLYAQGDGPHGKACVARTISLRRRAHERRGFIGKRRCGPGHSEVKETWVRPAAVRGTGSVGSQVYSVRKGRDE